MKLNKILLVGSSLVNPMYFNQRLRGIDNPDTYSLATVLEHFYNVPVTSLAINGAGFQWCRDAVISNLSQIDKKTLVIVQWPSWDRSNFYFNPSISNLDLIDDKLRRRIRPKGISSNDGLYNTFSPSGALRDEGLRFWISRSTGDGIKDNLSNILYTRELLMKEYLECVILVQSILKTLKYKQKHIFAKNIFNTSVEHTESFISSKFKDYSKDSITYRSIDFNNFIPLSDIVEEYTDLKQWVDAVDWDLFVDSSCDEYFSDSGLPWHTGTFNLVSDHQPPYNWYNFVSDLLWEEDVPSSFEQYYIEATREFCKEYNLVYPGIS